MANRGFGVAGALDHDIIRQIARAAEASGYTSFWANDTPRGDGLAALAAAASVTSSIRLGVGVIPVDRRPPKEIAKAVHDLDLPRERLVIGIGSGGTRRGGLALVERSVDDLLQDPGVPVVIGALGPRMCRLSAERANGALLNWLTPEKAAETHASMTTAASALNRPAPYVAGYVRAALGDEALDRLRAEAGRYERIPQYARHFESMGVSAVDTSVTGADRDEIDAKLSHFDQVLDETVVRAITAQDTAERYLALLRAAAPS